MTDSSISDSSSSSSPAPETAGTLSDSETDSAGKTRRFFVVSVLVAGFLVVVALAIPARLRLHGLFPAGLGLLLGLGTAAQTGATYGSRRWVRAGWVAGLAMIGWGILSVSAWRIYAERVETKWAQNPATLALSLQQDMDSIAPPDQLQKLLESTAKKRLERLNEKKSWSAWLVARIDRRLGIAPPILALTFWIVETALAGVAAFCGFCRGR